MTWEPDELPAAIASLPPRGAAVATDAKRLNAAVRAAIFGDVVAPVA